MAKKKSFITQAYEKMVVALVVELPDDQIHESDRLDNVAVILVEFSK